MEKIDLFKPTTGPEEAAAVQRVLESGWLGNGPEAAAFEKEFADYIGVAHAVALNSCTAALHLSLMALGIGEGDLVAVPAISFISTAHAVRMVGATPVFIDVDERLSMDPESLHGALSEFELDAVILVHYAGHLAQVVDIAAACRGYGIPLVEDCAHAVGTWQVNTGWAGAFGAISCFSFAAVKPITCGDGGMVLTDDPDLAAAVRQFAWLGIDRGTYDRSKGDRYCWSYEVSELGYKYHMADIAAAIGRVQLSRYPEEFTKRSSVAIWHHTAWLNSAAQDAVGFLEPPPLSVSCYHLMVIEVAAETRDRLRGALADAGITTSIHYRPMNTFGYYGQAGDCPDAERYAEQIISLPMHTGLSKSDVKRIWEVISDNV